MRRAELISVVGMPLTTFENWHKRGHLPFHVLRHQGARGWQDFTFKDAFELRLMMELTGTASPAEEPEAGVGLDFACRAVANALAKSGVGADLDAFRVAPFDAWLGFAVIAETDTRQEGVRSDPPVLHRLYWFSGALERVVQQLADEIAATQRLYPVRATASRLYLVKRLGRGQTRPCPRPRAGDHPMIGPTPEQLQDFADKAIPILSELVEAEGFTVRRGHSVTRATNLCCGGRTRTRAERAFQEKALRAIGPGALYPDMCSPAPAPRRVV